MISFELSNGNPYGPLVLATLDDDQYVEYELDDLTGFPSNAEEEERMFMEAVMESLKDMEVRHPQEEQLQPGDSTVSEKSSEKGVSSEELSRSSETKQASSSMVDHDKHSNAEVSKPLKDESNSNSVIRNENCAPETCPELSPSSRETLTDASSITDMSHTSASARSDSSASVRSSLDTDVSHNTKATVTVVKNPASHVMDGLMRRWDFKFFRNSNGR